MFYIMAEGRVLETQAVQRRLPLFSKQVRYLTGLPSRIFIYKRGKCLVIGSMSSDIAGPIAIHVFVGTPSNSVKP
jgi:hypothetical protein